MWSLENVWRIVVVVAASASTAVADVITVAAITSFFKRKTRMNHWIRCKYFYTYTQKTGYEF